MFGPGFRCADGGWGPVGLKTGATRRTGFGIIPLGESGPQGPPERGEHGGGRPPAAREQAGEQAVIDARQPGEGSQADPAALQPHSLRHLLGLRRGGVHRHGGPRKPGHDRVGGAGTPLQDHRHVLP